MRNIPTMKSKEKFFQL